MSLRGRHEQKGKIPPNSSAFGCLGYFPTPFSEPGWTSQLPKKKCQLGSGFTQRDEATQRISVSQRQMLPRQKKTRPGVCPASLFCFVPPSSGLRAGARGCRSWRHSACRVPLGSSAVHAGADRCWALCLSRGVAREVPIFRSASKLCPHLHRRPRLAVCVMIPWRRRHCHRRDVSR